MFKALKRKMKDQRGLTLIELLAVIVILGIIAAIAIPSIGGLITKTKNDAKVAEAIQIINAAKLSRASNASITQWDDDGSLTPSGGGTAVSIGKIGDLVENVKDAGKDYLVEYVGGVYRISEHDANTVVSGATTGFATEDELLKYSGN
ncbi:hypothetical protein AM500_08390 [Bacillus sp. FJAT-18017]|uniref:prepilin-type N-terminal cleavage/methylation domain-containing protein n=1 Tax=Bacillus sp. FJAT-18017 TaxID=1705566 RepID=UPI0006BDF899|nr:prepilin-type N-terminal cleavage/methylation domain-containing protein [Bacillus sp. FJAT-18017]ALC89789.1 hypothetical protein AM500_08390 [Bacillus sp. FJAT-18017]